MKPLIDEFNINPSTNKTFIKIIEMFDNQPNYQFWAVRCVFNKVMTYKSLVKIHNWITTNHSMIKDLERKNIVAYNTKSDIPLLFSEMRSLEKVKLIKNTISKFNTEQRKMLTSAILPNKLSGFDASIDPMVKKWYSIFNNFNKMSDFRKRNFYTKASSIRDAKRLMRLIRSAVKESYTWNKEEFLSYLQNYTKGCEVVFNQGSCVIITVPNFEMSVKLCGGGRTQWCISINRHHWADFVGDYDDAIQYFLFDFSRRETDPFAHIGFTIERGSGIMIAQSGDNNNMLNDLSNGVETLNIKTALRAVGVNMNMLMHCEKNDMYDWNVESILSAVKDNPRVNLIYSKDNRLILKVTSYETLASLISHTFISIASIDMDYYNDIYVLFDTNLAEDDEESLFVLTCIKDAYGVTYDRKTKDVFGADCKDEVFFKKLDKPINEILLNTELNSSLILHKLIDTGMEREAITHLIKEWDTIDINYQLHGRLPIFSLLSSRMFNLFEYVVSHPKFDVSIKDGFGDPLLESLLLVYKNNELPSRIINTVDVERMINVILNHRSFNVNDKDIEGNTALIVSCTDEKMLWVTERLLSLPYIDVNSMNIYHETALRTALIHDNVAAVNLLCTHPNLIVSQDDFMLTQSKGINICSFLI